MKKRLWASLAALLSLPFIAVGCNETNEDVKRENPNEIFLSAKSDSYSSTLNSLVAIDELGREFGETLLSDKQGKVGLFYWLWQGAHVDGIYDVSNLEETDPDALWGTDEESLKKSPLDKFHYWGEPLYGYYDSKDPWVIRRHLELFTMSGIDYLALDLTNNFLYNEATETLLEEILRLQQQGWNPPKLMGIFGFLGNSAYNAALFYERFYTNPRYDSCWYKQDGKPVISLDLKENGENVNYTDFYDWMGLQLMQKEGRSKESVNQLISEMKAFFSTRNTLWPYEHDGYNENVQEGDMNWIDWKYPQTVSPDGYISVSVAQHVAGMFSVSGDPFFGDIFYNKNWGRGWDIESETNSKERILQGSNLENQWKTALNNENVKEVFVTGWNEWIACKLFNYGRLEGTDRVGFVDNFNYEFSRDMEMMKGGYGDNYYLQNMRNVRNFKSERDVRFYAGTASPALHSETGWSGRTYMDIGGDAIERNYKNAAPVGGFGYEVYTNTTNRNDIVSTQVVNDGKYLYIKINTLKDIVVDPSANNNLNILLSVQGNTGESWEGYQYLINRQAPQSGSGVTTVERAATDGKYEWVSAGNAETYLSGKTFAVKIPLELLGIKDSKSFTVDFKVADGISDPSDIMKYYIDGDSAPIGRLNYRYNAGK